jgi:hypothetical protein
MSQVFISYRHSPHGHSDRVKNLMHTLRQAGVNILCDQQLTGGPDEGWTMWSQQQVERADKVLIACTAGWAECYEANQPLPAGLGSVAEARIIRRELANNSFINPKYRIVLLAPEDTGSIPTGLQDYHHFRWYDAHDQAQLLAWLKPSPAAAQPPAISWPTLHTPFDRRMANRDAEFQLFEAMLQGRSAQRALLIQGESGRGKSTLVKAFVRLARQLRLGHTLIDCKYTLSLGSALSALEQDLAHTSNPPAGETPEQHSRRVLAQLKALPQPYLLLLDTFEQASPELSRWLEHDVLARLPDYPALLVVVCGQKVPQAQDQFWQDDAHTVVLQAISNPEPWHAFCKHSLPADFIQTLVSCTRGNPALIAPVLNSALQQGSPA